MGVFISLAAHNKSCNIRILIRRSIGGGGDSAEAPNPAAQAQQNLCSLKKSKKMLDSYCFSANGVSEQLQRQKTGG